MQAQITEIAPEFRPPPASVNCLVVAAENRQIVGSLIGLGDGDVDFT